MKVPTEQVIDHATTAAIFLRTLIDQKVGVAEALSLTQSYLQSILFSSRIPLPPEPRKPGEPWSPDEPEYRG